eukprot:m.447366 g.447366  ORF g.447366 m.447366 type:complete len:94 (+) comp19508_c0_seq1:559-840(+)
MGPACPPNRLGLGSCHYGSMPQPNYSRRRRLESMLRFAQPFGLAVAVLSDGLKAGRSRKKNVLPAANDDPPAPTDRLTGAVAEDANSRPLIQL